MGVSTVGAARIGSTTCVCENSTIERRVHQIFKKEAYIMTLSTRTQYVIVVAVCASMQTVLGHVCRHGADYRNKGCGSATYILNPPTIAPFRLDVDACIAVRAVVPDARWCTKGAVDHCDVANSWHPRNIHADLLRDALAANTSQKCCQQYWRLSVRSLYKRSIGLYRMHAYQRHDSPRQSCTTIPLPAIKSTIGNIEIRYRNYK